jgi:hypothetical protein
MAKKRFTRTQLRDPAFFKANQQAIEAAAKAGLVVDDTTPAKSIGEMLAKTAAAPAPPEPPIKPPGARVAGGDITGGQGIRPFPKWLRQR